MKTKYFTTLATASILSLGLMVGCSNPQADTTNPEVETNLKADITNPEVKTKQTSTSNTSTDELIKVRFYTENGVAIDGTDPVTYFQQSKPVPGSSEYTYEWMNATWQFTSAENRDLFTSNPEKYAPQYGGFCAWAVSQGYTAPTEPDAWKIVDGKLYLNFNEKVQKNWEKDISGNIAKANRNWPGVLNNS